MTRLAILVLLVVACRSSRPLAGQGDGAAPPAEAAVGEADGPTPTPDALGVDLTVAPDAGTLPDTPAPFDRPVDLAADRSPPPDLGPPPRCEMALKARWDACTYVIEQRAFSRYWMDSQCGRCQLTENGASRTISHCLYGDTEPPTYCVAECKDCCFKKAGAPCEIPADCCKGLVCTSAGGKQTCELPAP